MMNPLEETYQATATHLSTADPVLASVIARSGPCTIEPHGNYYAALVSSIIGQQLSIKAAETIKRRFCELYGGDSIPSPERILEKDIDALRSTGLSRGKALYIRDLAQHVASGKVRFDHLDQLSNEKIITELTAVKGIGEWTVHMFLIFCMGRLDVLAPGDLGIRNAVRNLYGFSDAPTPKQVTECAEKNGWAPYQSIACWYLWRSLDNVPSIEK